MNISLKIPKGIWIGLAVILIAFISLSSVSSSFYLKNLSYSATDTDADSQDKMNANLDLKGSDSSIVAPFVSPIEGFLSGGFNYIGYCIINAMTTAFDPSMNAFGNLLNAKKMQENNTYTYDDLEANQLFQNFINGTRIIGMSLATLFLVWNLLLCAFGQAQAIKTTPLRAFMMYALSMFLIFSSSYITYGFSEIVANLWTEVVIKNNGITLSFDNILDGSKSLITDLTLFIMPGGWVFALIKLVFQLFIEWKLIKGCLKLFFEIIERYFVLMLLFILAPVAAPAIISPGTSNITKSYIRMIFSQSLVMVITGMLMRFYSNVLLLGGWTAGIINFMAALVFLRVVQRLDSYMASLGLNVAQTGAGVFEALLGGGGFIHRGTQLLSNMSRGVSNVGKIGANVAVATGNKKLFDVMNSAANVSSQTFMDKATRTAENNLAWTDAMNKRADVLNKASSHGLGGNNSTFQNHTWKVDSATAFSSAVNKGNMSPHLQQMMDSHGINADSVDTISKSSARGKNGSQSDVFTFKKDGNIVATSNGHQFAKSQFVESEIKAQNSAWKQSLNKQGGDAGTKFKGVDGARETAFGLDDDYILSAVSSEVHGETQFNNMSSLYYDDDIREAGTVWGTVSHEYTDPDGNEYTETQRVVIKDVSMHPECYTDGSTIISDADGNYFGISVENKKEKSFSETEQDDWDAQNDSIHDLGRSGGPTDDVEAVQGNIARQDARAEKYGFKPTNFEAEHYDPSIHSMEYIEKHADDRWSGNERKRARPGYGKKNKKR